MKSGGRILAEILDELGRLALPGRSAMEIELRAQELLRDAGVSSPFEGYQGYPFASCVSINDEVVHGLPEREKVIQEGDLVGIDLGLKTRGGLLVDSAITVGAGEISSEDRRLLEVAKMALEDGIAEARAGNRVGDIAAAIEGRVRGAGFRVIRNLCGHGIGRKLHEEPEVPNFGKPGEGASLAVGMTICVEPMVAISSDRVVIVPQQWPARTSDGSRSAHFEHTVAITAEGPLVLTERKTPRKS